MSMLNDHTHCIIIGVNLCIWKIMPHLRCFHKWKQIHIHFPLLIFYRIFLQFSSVNRRNKDLIIPE